VDVRRNLRGDLGVDLRHLGGPGAARMLDVVTVVFFVGVTIAGMVGGATDRDWMDTYATTLSGGVLA
jgi:hypothetical protein